MNEMKSFAKKKKPSVVRQVNFVSLYGTVHAMRTVQYMRHSTCDAYSTAHALRTVQYMRHSTCDAYSTVHALRTVEKVFPPF